MLKILIERPIAVTMALLVVIVLGFASIRLLPVSLIPDVDIPYITIQLNAPNMAARELDESVVNILRQQLIQIDGLKDIVSESTDGSANIKLIFDQGDDIDYIYIEVNEKIDRAMSSLSGIDRPKVLKASATDIPAFYINMTLKDENASNSIGNQNSVLFPVSEEFSRLSIFAKDVVVKRIEQLSQVAMVDVSGFVDPEILILPDSDKLQQLGISINEFENFINAADVKLGSLTIRDGQYRYNVKFRSTIGSKDDVENIWFKTNGRILQIKDIANVIEHPAKRVGLVRSEGNNAVCIAVIKNSDARMSELKNAIDDLMLNFEKDYPDVSFEITRDQTRLLEYSINNLIWNIVLGLVLACLIIFLFMKDFRSPILVSLSMPLSLIFSMLLFYVFGLSLNIISLSGVLLGVGMMADNTIILVDNITSKWQRNKDLRNAIIDGTKEVMAPMLSSLLTTCAVFVPLVFVKGIAGALFYDQAMAVSIVLITSYIVTITIVPVYYYQLYKKVPEYKTHPSLAKIDFIEYLQRWDNKTMKWFLRHRQYCWIILIVSFFGCLICIKYMPKEKLPKMTATDLIINVDWNEHISIEENEKRASLLENLLNSFSEQTTALVGAQQFVLNHSGNLTPSELSLYVKCNNSALLKESEKKLSEYLSTNYPHCLFSFEAAGNIFNMVFASYESPLSARLRPISTPDIQIPYLKKVVDKIKNSIPEVDIQDVPIKKDLLFVADPDIMALYDISFSELAAILKNALNENKLFEIVQGSRSLSVIMGVDNNNLSDILEKTFYVKENLDGTTIQFPISSLMRKTWEEDLKSIVSGFDGNYYAVNMDISNREIDKYIKKIKSIVDTDGNFDVRFEGSYFSNNKIVKQMIFILCIAIILLYLILASQFESLIQPLIILSEIIIDVFSSLLVLWILDVTINLMSLIGLVVISGIVINDSILKIDTINHLRKDGINLKSAIIIASRRRMKSIIMTSLTTILAVCPFLARGSMGADLQYPLSLVIIAGMTIGTFVSLFIVPAIYYSIYRNC